MNVNIDWHKLQALQHFAMYKTELQLDDLVDLLQLQQLRTISCEGCTVDRNDLAAFTSRLAKLRPNVKMIYRPPFKLPGLGDIYF